MNGSREDHQNPRRCPALYRRDEKNQPTNKPTNTCNGSREDRLPTELGPRPLLMRGMGLGSLLSGLVGPGTNHGARQHNERLAMAASGPGAPSWGPKGKHQSITSPLDDKQNLFSVDWGSEGVLTPNKSIYVPPLPSSGSGPRSARQRQPASLLASASSGAYVVGPRASEPPLRGPQVSSTPTAAFGVQGHLGDRNALPPPHMYCSCTAAQAPRRGVSASITPQASPCFAPLPLAVCRGE